MMMMMMLQEIINFDVKYESPSGHISDFADGFNQSISGVSNHSNSSRSSNGSGTDQHPPDEDDDDDDDGLAYSCISHTQRRHVVYHHPYSYIAPSTYPHGEIDYDCRP